VRCMSRSAILLQVSLVNFMLFQLRNELIHGIVTVTVGVESLREKNGSYYAPTRTPTQTPIFSSCSGDS
jgi:hypothetical protein